MKQFWIDAKTKVLKQEALVYLRFKNIEVLDDVQEILATDLPLVVYVENQKATARLCKSRTTCACAASANKLLTIKQFKTEFEKLSSNKEM